MLGYNIATAICLGLMAALVLYVVISLIVKNRRDRIAFVRGFKKGKGFLIYFISVPLYVVGHIYSGNDFATALLAAINKAVTTIVLKYEVASISGLMAVNAFYRGVVYSFFVVVALNMLLLSFSVFNQNIWASWQNLRFLTSRRAKLIIIGANPTSVTIYESALDYAKLIVEERIPADVRTSYYARKVAYFSIGSGNDVTDAVVRLTKKAALARHVVIINTQDDERNLHICRQFYDYLHTLDEATLQSIGTTLQIYVFGNSQYDDLYDDLVDHGSGIIRYVDRYQQIATDFIDKYPLTHFMDARQIDYATSLVKPDVNLNVMLVGFGDTNQKIFMTSVANNQFLTRAETGDAVLKQVNYHIFDKANGNNKNLNHNYYRYRDEVLYRINPPEGVVLAENDRLPKENFLPLPAEPAHEYYYGMSIDSPAFYARLRQLVTQGKDDVNYVIIAFGSDLANLDLAQKLLEKRREWGAYNMVIFVKAKTWCKEYSFMQKENCYIIADLDATVYNLDHILNDRLYQMAMLRDETYTLESDIKARKLSVVDAETAQKAHDESMEKWHNSMPHVERESNVYCCLSLRTKLHLMGLDYCDKTEEVKALTEAEYLRIYAKDDMPRFDPKLTTRGKHIIEYDLNFPDSRRRNLAMQEHYRWNSFMISKGFIPATLQQIREEKNADGAPTKGKNYLLRHHGNLSTYEGLVTFRRIAAEIKGSTELAQDVMKYDYQLLDDAYWFLDRCGFQLYVRDESAIPAEKASK